MSIPALVLTPLQPIAAESTRIVYPHPTDPKLIVKVMRSEVLQRHRSGGGLLKRLSRTRPCKLFLREIQEQLVLLMSGEKPDFFLQRIFGFADTDLGLGQICEALRDETGAYAPTVAQLIRAGKFDAEARDRLRAFSAAILQSSIALHANLVNNVLYAFDEERGHRFVLIDGFGQRSVLPIKTMFERLNAKRKQQRLDLLEIGIRRLLEGDEPPSKKAGRV